MTSFSCTGAPVDAIASNMNFTGASLYETITINPVQLAIYEIMQLVPKEEITEIAEENLKNDQGFQAAVAYMKSEEWIDLLDTIRGSPEWKEFRNYIDDLIGIDVEIFCKYTRSFIENLVISADIDNTGEK